jgi:hypothetical protein
MKWAIVFYALFSVNGEPVEHISWGLTFPHHENCIEFYTNNKDKLIDGIGDFKKFQLPTEAVLTEVGCAHATADFEGPSEENLLTLKMPLWKGTET